MQSDPSAEKRRLGALWQSMQSARGQEIAALRSQLTSWQLNERWGSRGGQKRGMKPLRARQVARSATRHGRVYRNVEKSGKILYASYENMYYGLGSHRARTSKLGMASFYKKLNVKNATIWRIVHKDNLPWILENGLHCGSSDIGSPDWVSIGNRDLIDKRARHPVPISPYGVLSDYVPFYFTPFSVMMKNINTGWGGIQKRGNDEIVILVSKLHHVQNQGLPFVFTDMHAYYEWANFYDDLSQLDEIDWSLLQRRDFRRDPNDPQKFERYQAEALIHQYCPVTGLLGIVCYTEEIRGQIERQVQTRNLKLGVYARTDWYF